MCNLKGEEMSRIRMKPSHSELDGYWKLYIAPQQDGLEERAYKI